MKLSAIVSEIEEKSQKVRALFEEEDAKGVDHRATIEGLNREIEELEKQATDAQAHEARRAQNDGRLAEYRAVAPNGRPAMPTPEEGPKAAAARRSLGQQFVDSPEWKDYFKAVAPTGAVGPQTHVNSPKLVVPTGINALITGTDSGSAGAFVETDRTGIYETLGRRPLVLRDIISVRTTGSDLVEFVRMVSRTNNAAPVAEATATAGSSGVKPEGGFTFEVVQAAVKTVAEWVAATKRSLSDAGQLRGIIDQELRADLEEKLEDQILNGSGVGENFEGLDTVSGTQDQAYATSLLVTTRRARTLVQTVGRARPTAYVMNPSDWEAIDLLQDAENRYYFGGPMVLGTPRLWGLPVVECESQAAGNAWVGDFRKIVLWDREQAMISVSDSHSDFFIRNLVAVLGEMRAALGVLRPAAFVEVDLTP